MYNIEPIDPRLGRVLGEKKAASIAMKVWGAAIGGSIFAWLGAMLIAWILGGDWALALVAPIATGVVIYIWVAILRKHMPANPLPEYLEATKRYTDISNQVAWEAEQKRQEDLNKIIEEWDD